MLGSTHFQKKKNRIKNAIAAVISSAALGYRSAFSLVGAASWARTARRVMKTTAPPLDDERERDAEQRERLDQADADEHRGADLTGVFGVASHCLDRLADQDPQPDAGTDRGQTDDEPLADGLQTGSHIDGLRDEMQHPVPPSLVLFRYRLPDVGGAEDREDERLQCGNEDLEDDEPGAEHIRDGRQDPRLGPRLDEEQRAQEEDRQKEVPGQEVGPQTHGQRDRPHDDVRDELDHQQQRVPQPPRRRRDDAGMPQVPDEAVLLDTDDVVGDPRHHRENEGEREPAARCQAEPRQHLEQVRDQDEEEERGEKRHELRRLRAEHGRRDVLADEVDAQLSHQLQLARHDLRLPKPEEEQCQHDDRREDEQHDDEVEARVEAEELEGAAPAAVDEVLRARWLEDLRDETDHEWVAPSNVHMSACIRRDRIFASYTRSAITAGMRAQTNASGENHASVLRPTRTIVKTIKRTRKPPRATIASIAGETLAAQAIESGNATKLTATIVTVIAEDHAAPAPPAIHPMANAAIRARGTNGRTRPTSSRSGSTVTDLPSRI